MILFHSADPQVSALDSFLAHGFEAPAGGSVVVYRALPGPYLQRFPGREIQCQQTCKPPADALARFGFDAAAEPAGPADLCIVFATKHKEETLYHFARSAELLDEGGTLIASAANDLGAASLERRCAELMGGVETYSKHKCRVFRARKDSGRLDHELLESWRRAGELQMVPDTGLLSRPGVFSWKTIDPGSRLLAGHLPVNLAGRGADLGAGCGYLSRELLVRSRGIGELHLFEAELKALRAAELNLANLAAGAALHFHWADVTAGLPVDRLDFVVMNPPFHSGRSADPDLGRAFIRSALAALKPDGRLYLVANRHLPYEAEIQALSGSIEESIPGGGFKVIVVRKKGR
jgi:16S rRNA (guanine1207-N2)-methyltransferase